MNRLTGILLVGFLLAACSGTDRTKSTPAAQLRPSQDTLDTTSARQRARQVSNVRYRIAMSLDKTSADYSGSVQINFDFTPVGAPLTVDFGQGSITSLRINGKTRAPDYNDAFISIDETLLKNGANKIEVAYSHPWSQEGSGLYRFIDPEDGRVYTYSQFEEYEANRMFPCFDQPDLKASYEMSVDAPAGWQVISAAREQGIEDMGAIKRWHFPTTVKFSTYVFSLHAGEYQVWEDPHARIPSRLFARRSLARYVPVDDWFRWTRAGFDFYEQWFGMAYPFKKYDQVISPDYQWGAMENVAAVTFTEGYVGRGEPTEAIREDLANTILHEMAHMWFGDLVTMEWWDGLWLNESFATMMTVLALTEATEFKGAWHTFYANEKSWGYRTDALVTTHPIEVNINDARSAHSFFDGISYGKGAAVLKQLRFFVGKEAFQKGLQSYMREHAWGNTRLADLMRHLSTAAGIPLDDWVKQWLLAAGTNAVQVQPGCSNGMLTRLRILQTAPPALPMLRSHKLELALYEKPSSAGLSPSAVLPVTLSGATTDVPIPALTRCPAFVWPNHGDQDFSRVVLANQDLEFLRENVDRLDSPMQRDMVWQSLLTMTREAEMPLTDFVAMAADKLPIESDRRTLLALQRGIQWAQGLALRLATNYPLPSALTDDLATLSAQAAHMASMTPPGSDQQKLWLDHFIAIASDTRSLEKLELTLDDPKAILGWEPDGERRWMMLHALVEYGRPGALARAEAEHHKDSSQSGELAWLGIQAVVSDRASKRPFLDELLHGSTRTTKQSQAIMYSLFPPSQTGRFGEWAPNILAALPALSASQSDYFMATFMSTMMPLECTERANEWMDQALAAANDLSVTTRNGLREARQANQRCLAAGQLLSEH